MKFLCWLFNHKLVREDRSPDGSLECLYCRRCQRFFAMHHPTQWFGEWDGDDDEAWKILRGDA